MRDIELNWRGRSLLATTCAACCVVPTMVIAGAISLGVAVAAGVATGSAVLVAAVAAGVASRRITTTPAALRASLAAGGIVLGVTGLLTLDGAGNQGAAAVTAAVGLLAAAALLALGAARADRAPVHR